MFIFFVLLSGISNAQDIHFSQFSETPLQSNPALAGLFTGDMRLQLVNRTQWGSITVPFETNSLNAEFKFPIAKGNDFVTIGGSILHDKAGTIALTLTSIMPSFNFHKSLSDSRNLYLSAGFMGGYVERRLDRSKITTNSQYDGTQYVPGSYDGEASGLSGYSYLDGAAGLSLNGELNDNENSNFYVGVALHHFNKPKRVSFYQSDDASLLPKLVVSGAARTEINDVAFITCYAEFTKQGPFNDEIGGVIYSNRLSSDDQSMYVISGGAYLRWNDAIIPVVKLERKSLALGLSYDATISSLKTFNQGRGGFELSLTYRSFYNNQSDAERNARCPKF